VHKAIVTTLNERQLNAIALKRAGPAAWRGGAKAQAWKHQAALIFLVLFSSKEKRTREL